MKLPPRLLKGRLRTISRKALDRSEGEVYFKSGRDDVVWVEKSFWCSATMTVKTHWVRGRSR